MVSLSTPEIAPTRTSHGAKSYGESVPVLVRAVQEQQSEIEAQAEQIAALEARLSALEQRTAPGAGLPRLPGIAALGGLLACGLVVLETRKHKQRT